MDFSIITRDLLKTMPLPAYSPESSKADYGKLLIIAGSARLPGPAILSARAALRCGCGTVRLGAPASIATLIGIAVPELLVIPLPETPDGTASLESLSLLEAQYQACDSIILGPGLDANDETNALCLQVLAACPLPMLVDAQALVALGEAKETKLGDGARIFTPHPGEMKAMANQDVPPENEAEARANFASSWAQERDVTLVLKGRETLIASSNVEGWKNTAGTRGMGTAGSGDVLAGVIGSFLAQKLEPSHAAVWGVHLHAMAGELAAKERGDDGMIASDFLEQLPFALRDLRMATEN